MSTPDARLPDEALSASRVPQGILALIGRLQKAKELIMLAAFFGAGLVWVVNYFATREQLEALECFTKINVRMLQANASANQAHQNLRQIRLELREQRLFLKRARVQDSGYPDADLRSTEERLEELKREMSTLDALISAENKAAQRALTALTQNQCLLKEQRAKLVAQVGTGDL